MLNNNAKLILEYLISLFSSNECASVTHLSIAKHTGLPEVEVKSTLSYLKSMDYLYYSNYSGVITVSSLKYKGLHYKDFDVAQKPFNQTNIFNAPVNNSAVGNTGDVSINVGMSYEDALQHINSRVDISESDKETARKIIEYIENVTSVDAPLPKSFLSRFSDSISKHSWLPTLIGNLLIRYFIG